MSDGRALVLCSGGLDSSTLVAYLQLEHRKKVFPLFIDRGQRALKYERIAFESVVAHLELKENALYSSYNVSEIPSKRSMDSEDRGFIAHPERNLVLVSLAYGFAAGLNSPSVYLACNADDGGPDLPDTRTDFFRQLTNVLRILKPKGRVELPFANWSKDRIVKWAWKNKGLGPDFLRLTHSCWKDAPKHCGKCNACLARRTAFKNVEGIDDPTDYETI